MSRSGDFRDDNRQMDGHDYFTPAHARGVKTDISCTKYRIAGNFRGRKLSWIG